MKILHLIYDHIDNPWVGGGGAVRVRDLYRMLSDRHEITVVCGRYPGAEDKTAGNIRYEHVGSGRNNYIVSTFCYAAKAASYVRANAGGYDVVVEDFAPYNPVFSFLSGNNAVLQLHQREGLRHLKKYAVLGIPFFLIEKYYHRFFRNILAELPAAKEIFGLRGNVAILPNGCEPGLLALENEEQDYILFIGRFHINQKGLDTLSEAMRIFAGKAASGFSGSSLPKQGRSADSSPLSSHTCGGVEKGEIRLVMAGGGKDEGKVRKLFSDGRTEFAGYTWGRKKEELLRKSLFMVVPSRYEGKPLIIMDTAACGKPVIVSDIPELRYVVDAGFGLSFRAGNAKDLAEKIDFLLSNSSLRREMGKRAREYARDFTWDRISEQYERFLNGVLNRRDRA